MPRTSGNRSRRSGALDCRRAQIERLKHVFATGRPTRWAGQTPQAGRAGCEKVPVEMFELSPVKSRKASLSNILHGNTRLFKFSPPATRADKCGRAGDGTVAMTLNPRSGAKGTRRGTIRSPAVRATRRRTVCCTPQRVRIGAHTRRFSPAASRAKCAANAGRTGRAALDRTRFAAQSGLFPGQFGGFLKISRVFWVAFLF